MIARPALSLSLYLQDQSVLLVGSSASADERAGRLQDANAMLRRLTELEWKRERPSEHFFLIVANSDDDEVNREVAQWAREHATLCYAHDQPAHSHFAFPALAKRGLLQIAISTQGTAPALAAHLRKEFDRALAASATGLDKLLAQLTQIRRSSPSGAERMQALKKLARKVRLVGGFEIDSS